MNFKKRVNGSWTDTPHYIHKTDTDILTTLPDVVYVNDTTATVGLKGNMYQASGVSPDNPIMPESTGERTGQLIDYTQSESGGIDGSGNYVSAHNLWRSTAYTPIDETLQYFVSWTANTNLNAVRINYYASDKTHISRGQINTSETALTIPQNAAYLKWTLYTKTGFIIDLSFVQSLQLMINTGSTALPYEPYGYKIPISSANTTTPVYLGEVETTRRIRKYEFTGTESISTNGLGVSHVGFTFLKSDILSTGRTKGFCSHFVPQYSPNGSALDGITFGANDSVIYVTFSVQSASDYNLTDTTSIKAWLAQQYAAGTPVTVWYVLANEETGIVNEPLMKIGDYADTVSGITVPTITGKDTFDVEATLKPSEASLSYTGWHDAEVKEYVSAGTTIANLESMSISQMENLTIQELQGGNWV